MVLVQIVINLPPVVDGIGDYSLLLARRLRERHGLNTVYLVSSLDWTGGPVDGFEAVRMESHTTEGLLQGIDAARRLAGTDDIRVLLHSSVYGYEKRGVPFWLAKACEQWNRLHPGMLDVVHHELIVVDAPIWSSGFWLPPLQRNVVTRLAKIAAFQYTNTDENKRRLEAWSGREVALIANCSNIAEPPTFPPFAERTRDLLVFGRGLQRKRAYDRAPDVLSELCRLLGAEKIIDIGPPFDGIPSDVQGIPVVSTGRIPAEQVSDLMAHSIACFSSYPPSALGKSSAYQVACAHGTIPFVFDPALDTDPPSEYRALKDLVPIGPNRVIPALPDLAELSRSVYDRYQSRSSWALADRVYEGLNSPPPSIH